ncbi:MAG: hypothetical protein KJ614_03545, partial [Gammaproteobacteria bacterium]|uniref:beta strand repeat-containing protein n=1 Tax=Rhodoferax sp. TaxID=50421 RepID=UPI001DE02B33
LSAGAGGAFITESDGVTIDALTVAVNRVASDASISTPAISSVTQEDLSATGTGNLVLLTGGVLTVNAGTPGTSSISTDSGSITLNALGALSDVIVHADVISNGGAITIQAGNNVNVAAAVVISTAAPVTVVAVAGDVIMPGATISADSAAVTVIAGGTVQPGVVQTQGTVTIESSPTGSVVFNQAVDRQGQNINVVANSLDIQASLISVGATLNVAALPAATPVAIVIGGSEPAGVVHLSLDEINFIQDGFAQISFGNGQANQSIVLLGQDAAGDAAPVVFKDPLVLNASGAANQVSVSGQLQGDSLTIQGSMATTTTTMTAADVSMVGDVTLNGLIQVGSGITSITAGNNANDNVIGTLIITGSIAGEGGANETLRLSSEEDVMVQGTVSGIDGLTVTAARNVTFQETLNVTGNVLINAAGVVTFDKALTLTAGGSLTILGASSVVFANGATVLVDGNLSIDAQSLSLLAGADSLSSTGGVLTITSASASNNVMLGANIAQPAALGALNLTSREILAIGTGFSQVVIGETGLGTITVAGNADLSSVGSAGVEILGNTITVAPSATGGSVQFAGDVSLQAAGNVVLNAGISTAVPSQIAVVSTVGNISMAAGTRLDSRGGDIQIRADNAQSVTISTLNARSADLSVRGIVDIQAGSGTITDANLDTAVDIFAKAVNLHGYGPDSATGGDVLEAVADAVRVDTPQGTVVRHGDLQGRTHFDVIDAGKLYQQIVVVGAVTRVTEDPATLLEKDDAALLAAGLPLNSALLSSPMAFSPLASLASAIQIAPSAVSNMAVSRYLASAPSEPLDSSITLTGLDLGGLNGSDLLSDNSYGIANRLQQSYVLGSPGEQPFSSGLDTFSQDTFEYWVDTLSL